MLAGGLAIVGLGHRRGWPAVASFMSAVVFMLGGSASSRLNHSGIILCYGLFPLALLMLEIALARRSRLHALGFALVTSMIVLGRNQVALMLCLVLLVLAAREVALARPQLGFLRDRLPLMLMAALVILAITAAPILLTLQLAALSNRPVISLGDALGASLYPANLATLFAPNIFGSHAPSFTYWGPHFSNLPEVGETDDSFNYLFIGAAPSLILIWLGLAGAGVARKGCRTLALILLLATLFSLGRYTPLFPFVFEYVPGFKFFRRPIDGTFVMLIAMALLSGQLLADYLKQGAPQIRPGILAIVLACLLSVLVAACHLSSRSGHGFDAAHAAACSAAIAIPLMAALALLRSRPRREQVALLITVVASAELLHWNAASRLNSEHRRHYEILEAASASDAEALQLLTRELSRRHREGARPRVEVVGLDGPWQNLAMLHKFEATNGYNPLRIGLYDRLIAPGESSWVAKSRRFPATFNDYNCALARALGLEYLVLGRPIEELGHTTFRLRHELLLAGPKVWIYRIPDAMPRVAFSSRIEVADADAVTTSGELRHPPSTDRVVIDDETLPPSGIVWMRAAGEGSKTHITSWRPGRVEIALEAAQAGVLVLHDTYFPGWVAELNGQRVPILRADVLFRAVEARAGRHSIVFRFDPLSIDNLFSALRVAVGSGPRLERENQ